MESTLSGTVLGGYSSPTSRSGSYGQSAGQSRSVRTKGPGLTGSDDDKLETLHKWAREDINRWQERNTRFQRDQDLYLLKGPQGVSARLQSNLRTLNDPKVLIKKVSRLIARHPPVIDIDPRPGVDATTAQKLENFLYFWDQSQNQKWMLGLNNPYRYDQAFYISLRGWICERTMLSPEPTEEYQLSGDPGDLFSHTLVDPANVYPKTSGDHICRVTHSYQTTLGEVQGDPLFDFESGDLAGMADLEPTTSLNVRALYWKNYHDGGWYHAVILGQGSASETSGGSSWVKKPTELGYNPWTIVLANGASFRQTPWDDIEYLKEVGTGLLDESVDTFRYLNQMATQLSELLSLESNPPVSYFGANQTPRAIKFGPGERNVLAEKDRVEIHKIGPQMSDYQALWDLLMQRASRAGLPPAFFAEYGGDSGFSAAIMLAAGKDILFPFTEAVNQADALKFRKLLEIYRDFGPPIPLPTRLQGDAGIGQILQGMGEVTSAEITPNEIAQQGTYVTITREDMTPQELATRINLALSMVQAKAISLETARKDWIKLRNPAQENMKVLAEQVYLSPEVIKMLVPMALSGTGQQYLQKIWEMTQQMLPPQMPGQMPGQPGGPEGGAPGGGPPGQGPPPPSGPPLPPQGPSPQPGQIPQIPGQGQIPQPPASAVPPITQGNLLTNTRVAQENPLAALLNQQAGQITGGAVGGAGSGGLPPRPGSTTPLRRFPPPGRRV